MTDQAERALLRQLLRTETVTRLRHVSQAGAPSLFKPSRSVTRYQHSVGVMQLARDLRLSRRHQIVALLHDSTHSAFSHTLDYLLANDRENAHENEARRLLDDRQLADLIEPADLTAVVDAIADKPRWLGLLDALDYTVRDLQRARLIDTDTAHRLRTGLTVTTGGEICFADRAVALEFVTMMTVTSTALYMDQLDLYAHARLAALLDEGIQRGAITLAEILTGDDANVLSRLAAHHQMRPRIGAFLSLHPRNLRERRDHRHITSKARLLDPPVLVTDHEAIPLSQLDPAWHRAWDDARRRADRGVTLLTTA